MYFIYFNSVEGLKVIKGHSETKHEALALLKETAMNLIRNEEGPKKALSCFLTDENVETIRTGYLLKCPKKLHVKNFRTVKWDEKAPPKIRVKVKKMERRSGVLFDDFVSRVTEIGYFSILSYKFDELAMLRDRNKKLMCLVDELSAENDSMLENMSQYESSLDSATGQIEDLITELREVKSLNEGLSEEVAVQNTQIIGLEKKLECSIPSPDVKPPVRVESVQLRSGGLYDTLINELQNSKAFVLLRDKHY